MSGRRKDEALTWLGHRWLGRSWFAPLIAAGFVFIAGCMLHLADLRPTDGFGWTVAVLVGLAGLVAGGGLGLLACGMPGEDYRDTSRLYMLAAGAAAAAWLWWAAVIDPYGRVVLIVFAAATFVMFVMWRPVRTAQRRFERVKLDEALARKLAATAVPAQRKMSTGDRIEAKFAEAGARGLEYVETIDTEAGFAWHMMLPEDGSVSVPMLISLQKRLEIVFARWPIPQLRAGAIRVEYAKSPSGQIVTDEVVIHFDVNDIMSQIVWMPIDHGPISVYDRILVGKLADGTPLFLSVCDMHSMIVGMTRYGKSNFLHVLVYQATRCVDAVIWFADFKGGSTVRPWIDPYLKRAIDPATGQPVKPAIDWAAQDRFEAERILNAAVAASQARPGIRWSWPGGGGSKWRATPERPAVLVITDEVAEMVGDAASPDFDTAATGATATTLGRLVNRAVCLGAGEGVWQIVAGQRGTSDAFVNGTAKAQFLGRVSFRQENAGDAGEVFQGGAGKGKNLQAISLVDSLDHPGSMVLSGFGNGSDLMIAKAFFMGDDDELVRRVTEAAVAHSQHRPDLDPETAAAIEVFGYSTRWTDPDRTAWMYGTQPSRPLRRWNAKPDPSSPAPGGVATATRPPTSVVDELGLNVDDSNPFAAAINANHPVQGVDAARQAGADAESARWAEIEKRYGAEMSDRAKLVESGTGDDGEGEREPDRGNVATDRGRGSPGYRRFIEIVDGAGAAGITARQAYAKLQAEGLAPGDKKTIYSWRDKAAAAGEIENPTPGDYNALLYTPRHWR
jgi:hypothetical protein